MGIGDCPNPLAVELAVLNLIPPERHELLAHRVQVELEDLGDSYRVTVLKDGRSVQKRYSDPARECDGRVRFAAVFSVLTLMPPELGLEPPAALPPEPAPILTPPPLPPPPPPAPPPPPRSPLAHIELSALYAYAPAILEAPQLDSFGGELRVALGRGALSGTLSVAYTTRAKFSLRGVQGDVSHLPLSAGLRVRSDFGAWALAGDLGLLATVESVRGLSLATSQSHGFVDLGLRTGVTIMPAGNATLAPFVTAFAWLSPAPRQHVALPQGVFGNLPYLWIGGAAGVSIGL